jgi:cytochrome c-type biogenesis protein
VDLSLALAFVAGVVSFLTPCVLALLPVYLAVLADAAVETPGGVVGSRAVLLQAGLFTLGFSAIFILLGISAGLIGFYLFRDPLVRQVAGVVVIVLGLLMTGLFGPVLDRLPNPAPAPSLATGSTGDEPSSAARAARTLGLGAVVAIGWTPCIGPVLGAVLALGASAQDVGAAALLLAAYAAGLALPFLAAAAFLPRLRPALGWLRTHARPIHVASGLAVAGVGVLIVLDAFTRLAGLFGEFLL